MDKKTDIKLISQAEAVGESNRRFKNALSSGWGLPGADYGIHEFNLLYGGIQRKKSNAIAARSGMGKTSIIIPILLSGNRIVNNKRSRFIVFSWEMTSDFIVDRAVCNKIGITNSLLTQAPKLLPPDKIALIESAYEELNGMDIVYHENSTNIDYVREIFHQFCEETRAMEKAQGIEIIPVAIIDYIGLASFGAGLRAYELGSFMNGIKKMVNMENAHAIPLAQINRTADEKELPTRSDLKDSGDIENACDGIAIIHRPEYLDVKEFPDGTDAKGKAMIRFQKNRGGSIGDMIINADVRYNRWYSLSHENDTKYWELYDKEEFWREHFNIR